MQKKYEERVKEQAAKKNQKGQLKVRNFQFCLLQKKNQTYKIIFTSPTLNLSKI